MAAITVILQVDEVSCTRPARMYLIQCRLQWQAVDGEVSESYDGITGWAEILLLRTALMLQWVASKGLQAAVVLAYASAVLVDVVKRRKMAHL